MEKQMKPFDKHDLLELLGRNSFDEFMSQDNIDELFGLGVTDTVIFGKKVRVILQFEVEA